MRRIGGALLQLVALPALSATAHAEATMSTKATPLSMAPAFTEPGPKAAPTAPVTPAAPGGRYYADSFGPLREDVWAFEHDPANQYTYCIRNVATYECLNYGSDASIRKRRYTATAHGTGFAYQHDGETTRLLTNEHVVAWPAVTDAEHPVEDVPSGCKFLSQKLQIVDNDEDEYEEDDVPLTRVVDDRALDVAVLRARGKLRLLPYRLGRTASLSAGDVVVVRGFPLGVFAAYNTGKIINTRDEDRYRHWDHPDFIVDAQLSSGNSGSPVLALSRKTGEYELVGVFHASYTRASSLNAVIAIEPLRELMYQLKRAPQPQGMALLEPLTESERRARIHGALGDKLAVPYVSLGTLPVRLHAVGRGLLFEIFSKRFPLDDRRVALILDAHGEGGAGKLQRVWFGGERGFRSYAADALDAETAGVVGRVLQRLYEVANSTLSYRETAGRVADSQKALQQRTSLQRVLSRAAAQDGDLAQLLSDLARDKAPASAATALPIAEVFSQIEPPPSAGTLATSGTR